jgi:hypothetical protein
VGRGWHLEEVREEGLLVVQVQDGIVDHAGILPPSAAVGTDPMVRV